VYTSALDASRHFTWDHLSLNPKYYSYNHVSLDDFGITTVVNSSSTTGPIFWGFWLNFQIANVGGQLQIKNEDCILWVR